MLTKLLNRQTYPLCLCVENIKIKNSNRVTDRGIELISKLCTELKFLSLRNCVSIKSNSVEKLVESCENLKYLDLTGCYNLTTIVQINKKTQDEAKHASKTASSKTLNTLYKKFNSYLSNYNLDLKKKSKKISLQCQLVI